MQPLDYTSQKQSISRKYILKITWSIIIIFTVQIATFFLIGKRSLHIEHFRHYTDYVEKEKNIGILLPIQVKEHEKLKLSNFLKDDFHAIEVLEDKTVYSEMYRLNPDSFGCSYKIRYSPPFFATVVAEKGTLFYGETWKMEFIWILGTWMNIKNENIGQS